MYTLYTIEAGVNTPILPIFNELRLSGNIGMKIAIIYWCACSLKIETIN